MQDEFEDSADLPTDTQSGGANTKGSINQGNTQGGNFRVAPEDSVASSDQEGGDEVEEDQQDQEPNFPARVLVTIERPNKGALQVATTAQDGMMGVESIYHFKDPKHVDPKNTADEANAARLYTGPPYTQLDDDLQVLFEKYLDERGINTTLALFVTEYIDYKEMREYLNWLKSTSLSSLASDTDLTRLTTCRRQGIRELTSLHPCYLWYNLIRYISTSVLIDSSYRGSQIRPFNPSVVLAFLGSRFNAAVTVDLHHSLGILLILVPKEGCSSSSFAGAEHRISINAKH